MLNFVRKAFVTGPASKGDSDSGKGAFRCGAKTRRTRGTRPGRMRSVSSRQPNSRTRHVLAQVQTCDYGWSARCAAHPRGMDASLVRRETVVIDRTDDGSIGGKRDGRLPEVVRRAGLWRLSGSREIARRTADDQLRASAQGLVRDAQSNHRPSSGILGPPVEQTAGSIRVSCVAICLAAALARRVETEMQTTHSPAGQAGC